MTRVHKLFRMSRRELAWRAASTARIQRDRIRWQIARPTWERTRLVSLLDRDAVDPRLLDELERRDWTAAAERLMRTLAERPRGFVLDPNAASPLSRDILRRWPGAAADASSRAERILSGRYDLLGYRGLTFSDGGGRIDWHFDPVHKRRAPFAFWADVPYLDPAVGDHKIIWELNRHQHWLALGRALWLTGDPRFASAIVSQFQGWLQANPPRTGINWASALELAFRALSWTWAIHFLLGARSGRADEGAWLIDMLIALDAQLCHVEQNLSYYFSPNTHLTGEALALYVCGWSFPELKASRRWRERGRRILLEEIDRQICGDGGHAERSTHYHRYTLDFYVLALLTAERAQDADAIARFSDAAVRAAEFGRAMADDAGRLPLIGDDDGGMLTPIAGRACEDIRDTLAAAAVVLGRPDFAPWGLTEEVFWIAGDTAREQELFIEAHRADAPPAKSRAFVETGYVVLRDAAGGHLVFDVGPHGYQNCGHAHADALAITLRVAGSPFLVDAGTCAYTHDRSTRDRLRAAASHNTLVLDGQPSSLPGDPFQWITRTDSEPGAIRHNPRFDWAEGWHDGYANRHRRTVIRTPGGIWLVADEVLGRGHHVAELHWHFDPAWIVAVESPTALRAARFEGDRIAWVVHDGGPTELLHGDEATGLGWFAPVYGTLLPTWTARVTQRGAAPFSIVTCVAAGAEAPLIERVEAEHDPGGSTAVAVRVVQDRAASITMVRPGEQQEREGRGCGVAEYHTDARLLHYSSAGGRLGVLAACDARHVLALRDGWLSIATDAPMHDVCVDLAESRIDVWSSVPAGRMRLQGAAVVNAAIRLNGRALPPSGRERSDSIVATGSDWGEPGRLAPCAASQASQI